VTVASERDGGGAHTTPRDAPDLETRLPRPEPYELVRTLSPLRHGHGDPTIRLETGRARRATRTPEGPATIEVVDAGRELLVRAWGPGAGWAVDRAADLCGLNDDPAALLALNPPHRIVLELARRFAGVRIPRTNRVVEALLPAVLEQKITGEEARRIYRALVRTHGEPAPGPFGLWLQPTPARLAALPYHAYHPLGLERRRAETLRRIGALADRLEAAATLPIEEAHRRLRAVIGIGPWTENEVACDALGDPDAVSIGDFHLPSVVAFALAGEPRADDARMLELLEPYRGQRGRVVRLLETSGIEAPKRGPRMPVRSIAGI
jgi:3-methyladenine DNA glycosylase/8-oxoguanine DNA glycosylase